MSRVPAGSRQSKRINEASSVLQAFDTDWLYCFSIRSQMLCCCRYTTVYWEGNYSWRSYTILTVLYFTKKYATIECLNKQVSSKQHKKQTSKYAETRERLYMVYVDPKYLAELESYSLDAQRYRYWRSVGINPDSVPDYYSLTYDGEMLDEYTDKQRLPRSA